MEPKNIWKELNYMELLNGIENLMDPANYKECEARLYYLIKIAMSTGCIAI